MELVRVLSFNIKRFVPRCGEKIRMYSLGQGGGKGEEAYA